jgi:hypothetical protein
MAAAYLLQAMIEFFWRKKGWVAACSAHTKFCNKPHRLEDGEPVNHECVRVPPAALEAMARHDWDAAWRLCELG